MTGLARLLSHINARLSLIALIAAGIGLVAMTAIVAWTVFGRYILNATPTWGEPVSLFLMLWFILLGGSVGVRELDHMGFDVGLHYTRGRWKAALVIANETLVMRLDLAGIAVSTGAACMAARGEQSHVIAALGVPAELARGVIRVSIGPSTTVADLDTFAATYVREVRALSG